MSNITHIVLFKFADTASRESCENVCIKMLALKERCIHPSTGQPYIKSASGGVDNSPEGRQNGITHAFVMHFETAADRDYYIKEDPAHLQFVKSLEGLIETVQVIDFQSGQF